MRQGEGFKQPLANLNTHTPRPLELLRAMTGNAFHVYMPRLIIYIMYEVAFCLKCCPLRFDLPLISRRALCRGDLSAKPSGSQSYEQQMLACCHWKPGVPYQAFLTLVKADC
jgi:hypothetical protein